MAKPALANSKSLSTAQALQEVLRDTYALYLLTHNYHWNVEGANFVGLHTLFETQYNELFLAIDLLAERIRALDSYALPNDYPDIMERISRLQNPLADKKGKGNVATHMIENLIELNSKAITSAQTAKRIAEKNEDDETNDLMVERIQVHQKANWMLRSIIK